MNPHVIVKKRDVTKSSWWHARRKLRLLAALSGEPAPRKPSRNVHGEEETARLAVLGAGLVIAALDALRRRSFP